MFKGTFDGNNKTITGLTINKTSGSDADSYQGLFGYVVNAVIKDVTLVDCDITGYRYVGGIVGAIYGSNDAHAVIQNCHVSGTIASVIANAYNHGGIAGYCKNTVVNYATTTGAITLDSCNITGGKKTGGVFGYYECNTAANDILLTRTYSLTGCKVEGAELSGGIAGEYKVTYSGAVTIDIDDYSMDSTTQLKTGTSAGGLFGKFTSAGSVTITDSDTTNTHFAPPSSSVPFGGIIGEYVNGTTAGVYS